MSRRAILAAIAALSVSSPFGVRAQSAPPQPVKAVVADRFPVPFPGGIARLPIMASVDVSKPQAGVERIVVVLHGASRNADDYFAYAERARANAGTAATLIVAPQFLVAEDAAAHGIDPGTARWARRDDWPQGVGAAAPGPVTAFGALDALLTRFADAQAFPALKAVVVAGHSAGGQLSQRYAAVARADAALKARGVAVRIVVANPSSYLWFGAERPYPPAPGACPDYDRWKYGIRGAPPEAGDPATLEARYLARDVVYLLGDRDIDPNHSALDKSCGAMAQGPNRFARGMRFVFDLEGRHPNLVRHNIFAIQGVAHEASKMLDSTCGRAALFGAAGCPGF